MGNQDDKLKEAELLKIKSETARNRAEQQKFLFEAKEIGKRISDKSNFNFSTWKAVVAGIVAAGLLTTWFINYMQPLLEKRAILSDLEIKIKSNENLEVEKKNEQYSNLLIKQQYALNLLRDSMIIRLQGILDEKEVLIRQYNELTKSSKENEKIYRDLEARAVLDQKQIKEELNKAILDKIKAEEKLTSAISKTALTTTEQKVLDRYCNLRNNWRALREIGLEDSETWEGTETWIRSKELFRVIQSMERDYPWLVHLSKNCDVSNEK